MFKNIFSLLVMAAITIAAIAGVSYYMAPRDFLSNIALLEPQNGPTAYAVFEIDSAALQRTKLDQISEDMAAALRVANPPIRYTGRGVVDDAARIRLVSPADMPRARAALANVANAAGAPDTIAYSERQDGIIEARLPFTVARDNIRLAIAQSIQIINRRVNPSGTAPVTVTPQGETRILVEARNMADSTRLRSLIGPAGALTFHTVREVSVEDAAAGHIPPGTMLVQPYPGSPAYAEVVESTPRLTGAHIADARPSADPATGEVVLTFQFDDEGARIFCNITRQSVGERFAVLIDNQVVTAPRINEAICGGSGQINGNFTMQSASDLAIILRAGAMPAPLSLIEEGLRPVAN